MKLIRKSITGTISSEDLQYLQYLSNQSAYNPRGGDLNSIHRISANILNGTNEPDKYVTIVDSKMTSNGKIVALAKYASTKSGNTKLIDNVTLTGKKGNQYLDKRIFITKENNIKKESILFATLIKTKHTPSEKAKKGIVEVCMKSNNIDKSKLFKKEK